MEEGHSEDEIEVKEEKPAEVKEGEPGQGEPERDKVDHDKDDKSPVDNTDCLLYTSPSPRDATLSRMPSSA